MTEPVVAIGAISFAQLIALVVLIWKAGRWSASVEGKIETLSEKIDFSIHSELEDHEARLRQCERKCAINQGSNT